MAAGMGSRFGGPKQTTPVDEYGHFLLHYSLFDAYRAGFRKVVFVVKEETAEEFRESVGPAVAAAFDVRYAYQKLDTLPEGYTVPDGRTKPWGTAHAVLCAAPEIDGPFAVINSDDYYGIEAYRLLYDFLAVPRPERSYAMVGFRLRNTVTANGSFASLIAAITFRLHSLMRLLSFMGHPPLQPFVHGGFQCADCGQNFLIKGHKGPPVVLAGDVAAVVKFHVGVAHSLTFGSRNDRHAG